MQNNFRLKAQDVFVRMLNRDLAEDRVRELEDALVDAYERGRSETRDAIKAPTIQAPKAHTRLMVSKNPASSD